MLKQTVMTLLVVSVISYIFWQRSNGDGLLEVDNAYVIGRISRVSSVADSNIVTLDLKPGDHVSQGQLIVELDDSLLNAQIERLTNEIAVLVRDLSDTCMSITESQLRVQQAEQRLNYVARLRSNNQRLFELDMVSENTFSSFDIDTKLAELDTQISLSRLEREQKLIMSDISEDPEIKLKLSELKSAFIDKSYRRISAPFDGVVQSLNFYTGNFVEAGQEILTLVSSRNTEIIANILEYKLTGVSAGKAVSVTVDINPHVQLKGRIKSITPGVSGLFSSVPVYNTDSNWIKVSQRIPVHITLEPQQNIDYPPVGASVTAFIDLRSTPSNDPIQQESTLKLPPTFDWQAEYEAHVTQNIQPILTQYRQKTAVICQYKPNGFSTEVVKSP